MIPQFVFLSMQWGHLMTVMEIHSPVTPHSHMAFIHHVDSKPSRMRTQCKLWLKSKNHNYHILFMRKLWNVVHITYIFGFHGSAQFRTPNSKRQVFWYSLILYPLCFLMPCISYCSACWVLLISVETLNNPCPFTERPQRKCISLMSSSPWAEHLRVAVLITTSSSNFLISWRGKINIFHILFLLNHIAKIFFCHGGLLHYQIALRSASYICWAIHVMRKSRHDDKSGRSCRRQAAAKCKVQQRSRKPPIYNHLFVEAWKYYWRVFSALPL